MNSLPQRFAIARSDARSTATKRRRRVARRAQRETVRDALVRERKRADRFEEAFVLVLISLDRRNAQPPRWEHLVEALSQTTLDADLIGWFEHGAVLGLIRSLDDRGPAETTSDRRCHNPAGAAALPQPGKCGLLLDTPGDLLPA